MTKIWFWPLVLGREDMKKISRPSADHEGALLHQLVDGSPGSFGVRLICWLPSLFIRNTEQYPSRKLMKAMYSPLGDQTGIWAKLGAISPVSCIGVPVPSASAVYMSIPRRNAICSPSGDQLGYLASKGGSVSRVGARPPSAFMT